MFHLMFLRFHCNVNFFMFTAEFELAMKKLEEE